MPRLLRHPATPCAALRSIDATATLDARGQLTLAYAMEGDIAALRIPTGRKGERRDELWRTTCCEAFLADPMTPGYLELNFAPAGSWAAYEFEAYRRGMRPLEVPRAPRIVCRVTDARLTLEATLALPARLRAPLQVALTAVIEERSGTLSYWALRHSEGGPDFHSPLGFALRLE